MSELPSSLKYTSSHEWVLLEDDGIVIVGITDHAQELLGDLVFVDLPEIGQEMSAGEECAVVESVKAASDVYSPIDGKIVDVNTNLTDEPELVNNSPYGDGWLFKLKPADATALDDLLSADDYNHLIAEEG